MGDAKEIWRTHPAFYLFESWDIEKRPQSVYDQAAKDDVDLNADDILRCIGADPHPFQTGFLMDLSNFRMIIAGNQVGKSLVVAIEILASATGEIPFSMRYPKGHDTGIPRLINNVNILRWGRRLKDSKDIIDHNVNAIKDDTWDCGNVTGVGIFPREKIVPEGSTIRIGSYQRLILQNWWPSFTGEKKDQMGAFVPPQFIDKSRGGHGKMRGFNKQDKQVFLLRGVTLQMLTYEAGKQGFEGIKVPTYLDEEPKDQEIIAAVILHSNRWSITETPYFGITYSRDLAFPQRATEHRKTFHATAYDCPYILAQELVEMREALSETPWEIGARIWGVPSEQKGKPYYDRMKINFWLQRYRMPFQLVKFEPTREWHGIRTNHKVSHLPGLMDVEVSMVHTEAEDQKTVWRLYEDRKDGIGYVSASDQADGAEEASEAGDLSTAVIGHQQDLEKAPSEPTICATIRSTLPTPAFTREALYAARYFNNVLLAPETGKGAANAAFELTASDWPFWFKDTIHKWKSGKPKENRGFCPTADRRETVFGVLIRDWLDSHETEDYPNCPDEWILREAAGAVVGTTKGGITSRCDHPGDGTIDSLMAYGILRFVMQAAYNSQIRCRGGKPVKKQESWLRSILEQQKPKEVVFLGEGVKRLR